MYDLLVVGAGLTAATLVASLRDKMRICVIDCRSHVAGNCYDYASQSTLVHRFGPHIFHSPSPRIVSYLGQFTEWVPYRHLVTAEVEHEGRLCRVPFPYSRETEAALGRPLSEEEILATFFRGYSQKMWGMPWDALPPSVRGRVPKRAADRSEYYRDHFVGVPRNGYTRMIENMLDGAELILNAPPDEWTRIKATAVVYTGRPDHVPSGGDGVSIAERDGLTLDFRTLDIEFRPEPWGDPATCLHACTPAPPWTRKTRYARLTGGRSDLVSTETPRAARPDDATPYYPIELPDNLGKNERLTRLIKQAYPHLVLAGRLGCYRYFDMYQAVGHGLALAERLLKGGDLPARVGAAETLP